MIAVCLFGTIGYARRIKVEALRQLGKMLKETPRNKGTRANGGTTGGTKMEPPDETPTLAELGLDKKTSKLAQDIDELSDYARIPGLEITIAELTQENCLHQAILSLENGVRID